MNENILEIPIVEYLEGIGVHTRKEGTRVFASSPFSSDRNWSFCVYPTNTYFDFSTGHGGNIINLVSRINGVDLSSAAKLLREGIKYEKYKPNYKAQRTQPEYFTPFDYEKYINTNPEECKEIEKYAASRGITEGYFCGVFFTRPAGYDCRVKANGLQCEQENLEQSNSIGVYNQRSIHPPLWLRVPALGFLHVDKDLKPCGAKFRRIDNKEPRFSARGRLGMYVMQAQEYTTDTSNVVYVVEGEANANSLWSFARGLLKPSAVMSLGGVATMCTRDDLGSIVHDKRIKLIIDYDGSEELYQERLRLYKDLNAEPIKLILPKGEDINSLYCKKEMWKIEHVL